MNRSKRVRRRVGDVVSIPLSQMRFGFGWVLEEPLVAFFDHEDANRQPSAEQIAQYPVAFRIWVMNHAITEGRWPVIGRVAITQELKEAPWFFKQDPLSGRLTITRDGAVEIPSTLEQCSHLERAAVWEPEHVEERLRDHFAGMPNKWVNSMRPSLSR